jgi:hypothetical protein
MDDFVVWDENTGRLRWMHRNVEQFVRQRLRLALKPACPNRCDRGMTFLGYRIYPHRLGLASRSRHRFRSDLRIIR